MFSTNSRRLQHMMLYFYTHFYIDNLIEKVKLQFFCGGRIVKKSKNSCRGAAHPSFNVHSLAVAPCASPYGLPIVAVSTVGFWLTVDCKPALGLAAAMLMAKYQK